MIYKTLFTSYWILSILTGINIPRTTKIGKGLRIHHYGCIIINSYSIIGDNCTIRHEVTIGNRNSDRDCPVIGNNCIVAAGAVVKGVFPDNVMIGGIPAKIIKYIYDKHD